jgi:hypothetical protein
MFQTCLKLGIQLQRPLRKWTDTDLPMSYVGTCLKLPAFEKPPPPLQFYLIRIPNTTSHVTRRYYSLSLLCGNRPLIMLSKFLFLGEEVNTRHAPGVIDLTVPLSHWSGCGWFALPCARYVKYQIEHWWRESCLKQANNGSQLRIGHCALDHLKTFFLGIYPNPPSPSPS